MENMTDPSFCLGHFGVTGCPFENLLLLNLNQCETNAFLKSDVYQDFEGSMKSLSSQGCLMAV